MKLVKESLSFERGQSPKISMGVGKIAQIRAWLDEMGIVDYTINDDLTIDVDENVDLSLKDLIKFPEFIIFGNINGYFDCSINHLISLKGAPKSTKKGFYCSHNDLTSLEGAPEIIGCSFNCSGNKLTSLQYSPKTIGSDFICSNNMLISLFGSPRYVVDFFNCSYNQLTSLEGCPKRAGSFYCNNNTKKFTKEEVRANCKTDRIYVN